MVEVTVAEVDAGVERTKRNSVPSVVGVLSVVVDDEVDGDLVAAVSIGGGGPARTAVDVVTGRTGGEGAAEGVVVVTSIGDGVLMFDGGFLPAIPLSSKTSSSPKGDEEEELDPRSMSVATPPFPPRWAWCDAAVDASIVSSTSMIMVFDEPAVTTGADAAEVPASAVRREEGWPLEVGVSPPQGAEPTVADEDEGSGDRVGRNTFRGEVRSSSSAGRGGGVEMEGRVPVDGRGDRTPPAVVVEGGDDVVDTLSLGPTQPASSASSCSATAAPPARPSDPCRLPG